MLPFPIISNLRQQSIYKIQKFVAGSSHVAILGTNGQLFTRGDNTYGQLGDTSYTTNYQGWQLSLSDVAGVYGDRSQNTVAIKKDGTVWVCGRFWTATQFGFTSTTGAHSWTEITSYLPFSTNTIKDIQVGYQMSAFVLNDGSVYFCGTNTNGQFGNNNTTNLTSYTKSLATDVQKLYIQHPLWQGQNVISYIDSTGKPYACGYNGTKQVSSSSTISSYSTFQLLSSAVYTSAAIAGTTSWYIRSNGSGDYCGSASVLQNTNSGILNMYSATGNGATQLGEIQLASFAIVYGYKTTNTFWAKTYYSGGGSELPLMNNVSNRANWLQQSTMPVSAGVYSGMAMGNYNNGFILFLGSDQQEIFGVGLMSSNNASTAFEKLSIPEFK
jgi:alpha-tubulin suppressor-like RCC1 family protein